MTHSFRRNLFGEQIMKFIIIKCSPSSCYILYLGSRYSPEHPSPKYLRQMELKIRKFQNSAKKTVSWLNFYIC